MGPGGNHEHFGEEGSEQQRQNERDQERLDRLTARLDAVFGGSGDRRRDIAATAIRAG